MNEKGANDLLEELRKQTALFHRANRINLIAYIILGIFVVLTVAFFPLAHRIRASYRATPQVMDSWQDARNLIDKGDLVSGMAMTQRLISKNPKYYYGYALLGSVYHEMGDLKKAEENYDRAFELFPIEDNEKTLKAIRKALERKQK
jgi:tetratricopeptide (TPR) repeat protein